MKKSMKLTNLKISIGGFVGVGLIIYGIIKEDYMALAVGIGFTAPSFALSR